MGWRERVIRALEFIAQVQKLNSGVRSITGRPSQELPDVAPKIKIKWKQGHTAESPV